MSSKNFNNTSNNNFNNLIYSKLNYKTIAVLVALVGFVAFVLPSIYFHMVAGKLQSIQTVGESTFNQEVNKGDEEQKKSTDEPLDSYPNGKIVKIIKDKYAMGCKQDSDCIKVDAAFCGCNAMGSARAILKQKLNEYNNCVKQRNKDIVCAQGISNDITCKKEAVPACSVGNVCVLVIKE